jgi:ASCH domain
MVLPPRDNGRFNLAPLRLRPPVAESEMVRARDYVPTVNALSNAVGYYSRRISRRYDSTTDRLHNRSLSRSRGSYGPEGVACGVHLAIFIEPYLELVLAGKKTIESRFSANRCPPYNAVKKGDLLLLNRSGGPVVGVATVGQVWSYDLDPESWSLIRNHFAEQLCITDPQFWASKEGASYATLMRVECALRIEPIPVSKETVEAGWS